MPQPQQVADEIVADQQPTPFVPAAQTPNIMSPKPAQENPMLAGLAAGTQLYDGINTMRGIGQYGQHEMNPAVAPFTHGGMPMMLAGGALLDLFKNQLLKHASAGTKNTADVLQTLGHLYGILVTNKNREGGSGWGI